MENIANQNRNFMECEMEVAVVEVKAILEEIEALLFGGHGTGVTNKRKFVEWQHITATVNTPDSDTQQRPFSCLFCLNVHIMLYFLSLYLSMLSLSSHDLMGFS